MAAKYSSNDTIYKKVKDITNISISYRELMTDIEPAQYFIKGVNVTTELTEEQLEQNKQIDSVSSFNVVVYTSVMLRQGGMNVTFNIDDNIYEFTSVNGLNLKQDFIEQNRSSIALYNISKLNVDVRFTTIDPETEKEVDVEIPDDQKTLHLYLMVEGLDNQYYPLYYVIYQGSKVDENSAEEPEIEPQKNEFTITDREIFDDVDNYSNYNSKDFSSENVISISDPEYEKYVFVNSTSVYDILHNPIFYDNERKRQVLKTNDNCLRIKVDPSCMKKFTISLSVYAYKYVDNEKKEVNKLFTFDYNPSILEVTGNGFPRADKMINPNVSYALLRTNPKLTGNVKVVVDSSSNIYLDTFKVSTTLSQRRYRHIKVDCNDYYGQTLMDKFSSVPSKDFYKVEDKCYSLFTPTQTYDNQYYDLYFSGVKTNDDKMYSENFAMLAPLCVKDIIPDFFLVFKVDKTASDYDEDKMTDDEKILYFIKHGKLIKSFDMRKDSVLGKYVKNISDNAAKEIGDLFVSYENTNYDKFIGISLDRGVVTSMYESPVKREYVNNQVALNEFYTGGFERNHLVSKNIINFEFMFNDTSSELFTIDTYFGLYVKVNEQENSFSCIKKIANYDIDSDENIDDFINADEIKSATYEYDDTVYSFPSGITLSKIEEYAGLIYGVTTPKEFIRLDVPLQDSSINDNFLLKPYRNIYSTTVNKVKTDDCVGFLTVKLNNVLEVGDHIRIIDKNNLRIYEVLMSNVPSEYNDEHDLSDVVSNYYTEYGNKWKIFRVSMYIPFRRDIEEIITADENPTLDTFIIKETEQLFYALRKFNVPKVFTSWKYNDNSISIVSYVKDVEFERICSPSGFTSMQKEYLLTYEGENETLQFFGNTYAEKTLLIVDNELINTLSRSYLYPYNFKLVGNRIGYAIKFLDLSTLGEEYAYYGKLDSSTLFDTKTILYKIKKDSSISSVIYDSFEISCTKNLDEYSSIKDVTKSLRYVQSYLDLDTVFFNLHNPFLQADTLLLYDPYPINSGICSIFSLKDFDFDVLDAKSVLSTRAGEDPIGTSGEYTQNSIFNYAAMDPEPETDSSTESESAEDDPTIFEIEDTSIFYGTLNELKYNENFLNTTEYLSEFGNVSDFVLTQTNNYAVQPIPYLFEDNSIYEVYYSIRPFIEGSSVYNQGDVNFDDVYVYTDFKVLCELNNIQLYKIYAGTYNEMINDTATLFDRNELYVLRPLANEDPSQSGENNPDYNRYVFVNSSASTLQTKFIDLGFTVGNFRYLGKIRRVKQSFVNNDTVYEEPIRSTSEENIKDYIDKYRLIDSSLDDKYSLDIDNSTNIATTRKAYYEQLINSNHNRFDISLTAPYTCKWKSIGTDARGENMRIMQDFIDASGNSVLNGAKSYFCVGAENDLYNKYLGYLQYINKNNEEIIYKKYITRSLNMHTYDYDESYEKKSEYFGVPYKTSILEGNARLDDILYDSHDYQNKFSVAYLAGDNCIEFISGGVKFRIKSNNDNAINLNNYKGYNVVFVSIPDIHIKYSKQTELIIDETTKQMMFIWYQPANTFRFGATLFNSSKDTLSYDTSFYPCRINFNSSLSDIGCTYIENTSYAKIPDDNNFYLTQEYTEDNEDIRWEFKSDPNVPTGKKLCNILGFIYIDTIHIDPNSYTKYNNLVLTGRLYDFEPVTKYINEKYSYYLSGKYVYVKNPILWHNEYNEAASITTMNKYCYDYSENINAYLYTDDSRYIVNNVGTYDKLKAAISSCSIYIKSYEGLKDYTKLNNILSISVIDPILYYKYKDLHYNIYGKEEQELGYVHSTFAEPVMKDMFKFGYTTRVEKKETSEEDSESSVRAELVDNVFKRSFDGSNVLLNGVNTINQIWLNKYTEESNFCIKTYENIDSSNNITYNYDANLSVDVRHDNSIISTCWDKELYRKYYIIEDTGNENYDTIAGYTTGYEMKTFINSRGINLNGSNGKSIEIVSWKNTEISDKEQYIKLDITDSVIYNILFRNSYTKSWRYLKLTNNTYKINYIKNTILPFININNKTKFVLYKGSQLLKNIHFDNDYSETYGTEITNYRNELKYENGKYYMYVYPQEYTTYSAKMIINL